MPEIIAKRNNGRTKLVSNVILPFKEVKQHALFIFIYFSFICIRNIMKKEQPLQVLLSWREILFFILKRHMSMLFHPLVFMLTHDSESENYSVNHLI
jgi:uncharacterized protein YybS (DUF2232 family)